MEKKKMCAIRVYPQNKKMLTEKYGSLQRAVDHFIRMLNEKDNSNKKPHYSKKSIKI